MKKSILARESIPKGPVALTWTRQSESVKTASERSSAFEYAIVGSTKAPRILNMLAKPSVIA